LKYILAFFVVLFIGSSDFSAFCQVEKGGIPRSFQSGLNQKLFLQPIEVAAPDLRTIQQEDTEDARLEKSYRVGLEIPVRINSATDGQWDELPDGGRLWRVSISCKGAEGLGLNYTNLRLPAGSDLFVYTADHKYVIGAFSSDVIFDTRKFTTRPLSGEELVVEYYQPANFTEQNRIEISGIVFMYRGFDYQDVDLVKSELSGSCEVNVNCEEGQNWKNQKSGVVKILTKVGSKYFYCTGTLLNNADQDFSGLLLTASHCSKDFSGGTSTDDDYSQWIFYFNYESPGCVSSGGTELTVVGAQKLAISDNPSDIGSDFLLLKALGSIPPQYNPFYCGWDCSTENSSSGVCIHHPDGDVKKISTYSSFLGSGSWETTPDTHWIVHWVATSNGYGVTEGGSSGAPLFDNEGLVIGTLTGGPSSCQNTSGEDMFGKVSYSWESNGTTANQQLKPWLDPANTGIVKLPGSYNDKLAVADFSANSTVIPVGGIIDFQDLSSGKPNKWHWYFQGGKPSESTDQNPAGVRFERFGSMNVKLVVSNEYNSDSIVKEQYIDVRAIISPNPTTTGEVNILSDVSNSNDLIIDVFDALGKIAQHFEYAGATATNHSIKLPDYGAIFIIRVIQGDQVQTHRVIVVDRQ
jgi:hypothetical protein